MVLRATFVFAKGKPEMDGQARQGNAMQINGWD